MKHPQEMLSFLADLRFADLLDILVVAALTYVLLVWLRRRGTRAVGVAAAILTVLYLAARSLDMFMTQTLFQVGFTVFLVALVLVFQRDIRRAFERLAAWRPASEESFSDSERLNRLLAETAAKIAEDRIGALIVLSGREPALDHIRGGIPLSGQASMPLLQSIFHPETPGHDGAVVIENGRIERFGAHLPLSRNLAEVGQGGTRHAAALGLAEICDALVIVVSEERGTVGLAYNGKLETDVCAARLAEQLQRFRKRVSTRTPPSRRLDRLRQNWGLKSVSIAVACGFWLVIANRAETVRRVYDNVPIQFRNLPEEWAVVDLEPENVRMTLTGAEREFNRFDSQSLIVSLDMSGVRQGRQNVAITSASLDLPEGLSLMQVDKPTISLTAYKMATAELEVQPNLAGWLSPTLQLTEVAVTPKRVTVILPEAYLAQTEKVFTDPISMDDVDQTIAMDVPLVLPENARLAEPQSNVVRVFLQVSEAERPDAERPIQRPGDQGRSERRTARSR